MRRALAVFSLAFFGCSKPATSGESIPLAEISMGSEAAQAAGNNLWPAACKTRKGDGKTYYADGFPHWADTYLCRNDDCSIKLHQTNKADGTPATKGEVPGQTPDKYPGYVPLTVAMKWTFGGFVDKPELGGATVKQEGVTSNKTTTTTGELAKDSLSLHLSDGTTVNNRVRVRAFFKINDVNGTCELRYVGGMRAP